MSVLVERRREAVRGPRPGHILGRAVAAAAALVGIVAGVPVLLARLGAVLPIDLASVEPGMLLRPDDGGVLLVLLLGLAWLAWAVLVASVGIKVLAAVRRVPTPRLPGMAGPQRLAAALVGSVVLSLGASTGTGAPATAAPLAEAVARVVDLAPAGPIDDAGARLDGPTGPAGATHAADAPPAGRAAGAGAEVAEDAGGRQGAPELPVITAQRHDTLWLLAEQYLGAGERFAEIVELNQGRTQPDGRALRSDGRVYPGWRLRLPADAVVDAARQDRHAVQRGDTLWDIAADELGDPTRFPEIFEANRGDLQPDGGRLEDADLIRTGWVLEIPDTLAAHAPAGAGAPGRDSVGSGEGPDTDGGPGTGGAPAEGSLGEGPAAALPPLDRAGRTPGPQDQDAEPGPPVPTLDRAPSDVSEGAATSDPATGPAAAALPDPADPDQTLADAVVPLPAGGTLTALLLAALAGELTRRRRQFQRHRRPGERMPTPTPEQRDLESRARDAVAAQPEVTWEGALRHLARHERTRGRPLPRVRFLRVGPEVHLHLSTPAEPVPPFLAVDDRVWVLDPEWIGDQPVGTPEDAGIGDPADEDPYPALVTVGSSGEQTVLVNLDEVGTVQVAGTPVRRPDALRALAAEVCLGRARGRVARTLCAADHSIAAAMEAGDLVVEPDPDRVAVALHAAMDARRSAGGSGAPADPIEVVVADRELPIEVPGRSGAALITTAPATRPGAILALDAGGCAVLLPEGIPVVPQRLPEASLGDLVDLLRATDVPEGPEDPVEPVAAEDPTGSDSSAAAPRILVLGEVRVEGATGRAESTRVGRLAETAAFVLLNPDARPSALQSALWPGLRSNPQTCRQMISRTRTWLGRTDAGDPYLMPFTETGGRLRLRPEVGSDWDQFQDLATAGLADPEDLEHLTAALRLVRGRPFGPVAGREMPWADLPLNDMVSLITDVAHALACRHEERGNWSAARDAALRGLRTESESEVLRAVLARIPGSA